LTQYFVAPPLLVLRQKSFVARRMAKNLYSLAEPANVRDDFQPGKEAENAVYSAGTQVLRRRRRAQNQPDRHRFRL
jgi:hypothetical protein